MRAIHPYEAMDMFKDLCEEYQFDCYDHFNCDRRVQSSSSTPHAPSTLSPASPKSQKKRNATDEKITAAT